MHLFDVGRLNILGWNNDGGRDSSRLKPTKIYPYICTHYPEASTGQELHYPQDFATPE